MSMGRLKLGCLFLALQVGVRADAAKVSLQDAFKSAITKSESLGMSEKQGLQSEERVSQAWGQIYPHLSLNGSYLRQESPATGVSSQLKPDQSIVKLTLVQPIFHGLRDFAALRGVQARARQQEAQKIQTKLSVYTSVAQSFYNVLSLEKDLENLNALLELTQKRSKELSERAKIGRSRKSELLTNETQVANLRAQVEVAQLQLKQGREQFRLATGLESSSELNDSGESHPTNSASLQLLLNLIEKRPDVVASKEEVAAREEEVAINRGQHFPSVDFTGNYYFHRTGILSDSKWDLGVVGTLPLFQGGVYQSQVREAIAGRQEKELALAYARRAAERDIRVYFDSFHSSIRQYDTLKEALRISEENYKATSKDYRSGLVTNLDVIQALNSFQETKRQFDRTHYQIMMAYASLQASVGQISE